MYDSAAMPVDRKLSGNVYVPARLRIPESSDPAARIPIRDPRNCSHVETICPTRECVGSWANDWTLFLGRTAGGRQLAARLGIASDTPPDPF